MLIPEPLVKKLRRVETLGAPMYLVGGAIRDALLKGTRAKGQGLNEKNRDFDFILPSQAPKTARWLASKLKGRLIELDEERKIFRVVFALDKQKLYFDFANFQAGTLENDLLGRDLTINAMALPIAKLGAPWSAKNLIDPAGGLDDINRRILRVPQEQNFRDDPLRILRTLRLAAQLDFKIETKTLAVINKHAGLIKKSAPERIRFELLQIMETSRAAKTLREMDRLGLLTKIFPVLERSRNLAPQYYKQGGVLGHSLAAVDCFESALELYRQRFPKIAAGLLNYVQEPLGSGFRRQSILKLIVLLHDMAKPHTAKMREGRLRFFGHDKKGGRFFEKIGQRLRFSNEEISLGKAMISNHLRPGNLSEQPKVTDRAVWRFFRDLGQNGVGTLLCALADHQSYLSVKKRWDWKIPQIGVIKYLLERYFLARSKVVVPKLITGHDVMKIIGIPAGPKVGQILKKIESFQGEGKIKTREQAISALKTWPKQKMGQKNPPSTNVK